MITEQALQIFADAFIKRVEQMKASDWKQGWFGGGLGCTPISYETTRGYAGINNFMLLFWCMDRCWDKPIFLTFNQIQKIEGAKLKKGSKSVPVFFWKSYYTKEGCKPINEKEFSELSNAEKDNWDFHQVMKSYNVFNIADTNLEELQPPKLKKILESIGKIPCASDTEGMYENRALDTLVKDQGWLCPIFSDSHSCYYSPSNDEIHMPQKNKFKIHEDKEEIFKDGQEYYASLLHEMAHSTKGEGRTGRSSNGKFGDKAYCKEELVAELTAALCSSVLGFDKRITDNSAAYLKAWCSNMKKEPRFLVSVLSDVAKASRMILEKIIIEKDEN